MAYLVLAEPPVVKWEPCASKASMPVSGPPSLCSFGTWVDIEEVVQEEVGVPRSPPPVSLNPQINEAESKSGYLHREKGLISNICSRLNRDGAR